MPVTISAAFPEKRDAKKARGMLESRGFRVTLANEKPVEAVHGICPGNGSVNAAQNWDCVMMPSDSGAVLTVLTDEASSAEAVDMILRFGGRTFH